MIYQKIQWLINSSASMHCHETPAGRSERLFLVGLDGAVALTRKQGRVGLRIWLCVNWACTYARNDTTVSTYCITERVKPLVLPVWCAVQVVSAAVRSI